MDEDLKWEAVQIEVPGASLAIASTSTRRALPYDSLDETALVPDGTSSRSVAFSGRTHAGEESKPSPIGVLQSNPASRGRLPVALLEGHGYKFRVKLDKPSADDPIASSLADAMSASIEWDPPEKTDPSGKEWHGRFRVQNYLGSAWIDAGAVRDVNMANQPGLSANLNAPANFSASRHTTLSGKYAVLAHFYVVRQLHEVINFRAAFNQR
jgi:hypothetical protein